MTGLLKKIAVAIVALAATAMLLTLMLIPGQRSNLYALAPSWIEIDTPDTIYGGIDHPAQVYGRIISGQGEVVATDGEPLGHHVFPTETRLRTAADESMQLQLVGKILSNIGPGLAAVGPTENFAFFASWQKLVMSMLMWLGRLEFFALLALFQPRFWRV